MNELKLTPIENNGKRVLTTAQLAESYGTDNKVISYNFNHNKERYTEGKHYYCLTGDALKAIREFHELPKNINTLYLWTEKGALLHAKSLNTDKAWEVYDFLVENYFRVQQLQKNIDSYMIEDSIERAKRWIQEEEERKRLKNTIDYQKPMVDLARLRIDKKGCYSITDVTKSLNLKRGRLTHWAKQNGFIHKIQNEVNKRGEKFFKVYSTDSVHNQIGVTDDGLHYISDHVEEINKVK